MFKILEEDVLIEGCSVKELAKTYQTPLYLYSYSRILRNLTEVKKAMEDYPDGKVAYAAKAFLSGAMIQLVKREGLHMDVVSRGELEMALHFGMNPERVEYNGVSKTREDLHFAIKAGVGRIIIDGERELYRIIEEAKDLNKKVSVLFRISPDVLAGGHASIQTGKLHTKFGFNPHSEIFKSLVKEALESEHVDFLGLHMHIGSMIDEKSPYEEALEKLLVIASEIGLENIKELNLGGGFAVDYTLEKDVDFSFFLKPLLQRVKEFFQEKGFPLPRVVIEPGRSLIANTCVTVYEVIDKKVGGDETYLYVDGGMADNPRVSLYDATYYGKILRDTPPVKTTIAGNCCETGDLLMKGVQLSEAEVGDFLVMYATGAYQLSMRSIYNLQEAPLALIVRDEEHEVMINRRSLASLFSSEVIPRLIGDADETIY